jgi:hypothetical protein
MASEMKGSATNILADRPARFREAATHYQIARP